MASANNGVSLTTAIVTIYDPSIDPPARGIIITNRSASSGNVLVNVANLHTSSNDYAGVPAGTSTPFLRTLPPQGTDNQPALIGKVRVKSDTTATLDWTLVR